MMKTKLRGASRSSLGTTTALVIIAVGLLVWLAVTRTPLESAPTQPLAAAGQASAPAITATALAPSDDIEIVRDPQATIALRIGAATGNDCFVAAAPNRPIISGDELDRRVTEAGGDNRWLEPQAEWVGLAESATKAFGASWAGRRAERTDEVWVQVIRDGADVGLQLVATKTPAGHTVWTVFAQLHQGKVCT